MARYFHIFNIELADDVTAKEFESWWQNEWSNFPSPPGYKQHILKGVKGERNGHYLLIIELDSMSTYNWYAGDGQATEKQFHEAFSNGQDMIAKFESLTSGYGGDNGTDYIELVY